MRALSLSILLLLSTLSFSTAQYPAYNENDILDPTQFLNFTDYAQYYSYPVETHNITTEDGYILTYFRIQAKYSTIQPGLTVVYLQHGLLDSADDWIINNESLAPGFILANRGYDVWLGNNRGNKYSLGHTTLSTNDPAFWAFSWDQFAKYDQAAAFSYIYNATGKPINYIGHSQGTTQMFAALASEVPEVVQYINTFSALGPVTYLLNEDADLLKLIAASSFANLVEDFQVNDFLPSNFFTTDFASVFCGLFGWACQNFLQFEADYNATVDNVARFNIFFGHEPCGTSTQNMLHWRQMALQTSYVFQMYDYGSAGNVQNYNQTTPPIYDLSKITLPVHLFVGSYDRLADITDATALKNSLTGSNVTFSVYPDGHITFLWGLNMSYISDVINIIEANN